MDVLGIASNQTIQPSKIYFGIILTTELMLIYMGIGYFCKYHAESQSRREEISEIF